MDLFLFFFHLGNLYLLIMPLIFEVISQRCVLIEVIVMLICVLSATLCLNNCFFYSIFLVITHLFLLPQVLLPVFF